jgi:septal ring factor EnvC (AmiA/AmiB activator)
MNSILIFKRCLRSEVLKNLHPVQIKNFNKYTKKTNDKLKELTEMIEKNNEEIKNLKQKLNNFEKK